MLSSIVNVSFAEEVEQGSVISYGVSSISDKELNDIVTNIDTGMVSVQCSDDEESDSCIPSKEQLISNGDKQNIASTLEKTANNSLTAYSATDFTFNAHLLTSFNTITGPTIGNGANEPKFSYNSFLKENISDYSGELTLNFEDLVLDGRNGLDLRIGRTYQTVASNTGEKSIMILPDERGYLRNNLVNSYSTYLLDRYNLGMGWGFSFPSVQIETEYVPQEVVDTYYYDEETELYYHSGNGEVYQVQFTADTTDSNLKGYYNKDIQFNKDDRGYSNGTVTSYYSMTLADKTKQYFAKDGRLIGIVDRFGNAIKFEHTLFPINNRVPEGNFKYDDDMWISSTDSNGTYDAFPLEETDIGSNDGHVMYFRRNNEDGDAYIISQPIQVKPSTDYKLGIRLKSEYEPNVKVEIIGYDTAYNHSHTRTYWIEDYGTDWYNYEKTFSMSSAVRYIQIKISPDYAKKMYIDTVSLDEPQPLISKITDSVGRVITFEYSGDLSTGGSAEGSVTLTVTSPDGAATRTLTYNKEVIEFVTEYLKHDEQRLFWYLNSSSTEGADGATVKYTYEGGTTTNEDGSLNYPKLYSRYDTKTHSDSDGWCNKPVLNSVKYKDRKKIYEYETVRKHLGDDGYYDTLRVKKKYDMYAYVPDGETKSKFKGELGTVNYSYSGMYNGNAFDNESGYPTYTFDDETNLNERWTVTKAGKTTDSITFSNCAVVEQTSLSGDTAVKSVYTNHQTFKNSPTQIKNTVTQGGTSKDTYVVYSYNDWGGIATESKEVDEGTKNNSNLFEKYITTYEYEPNCHYVTRKSYYNNINKPQVSEINTFDANGLLTSSENAVGEKTEYHYDNATYPFLITKSTMSDPMHFHKLLGGNRIVNYTYDSYGLYPVTVSESYDAGTAATSYTYDYITGDLLKETLPDGSDTQYIYYSDGKVKYIYSPFAQYLDGRVFYTTEYHRYQSNTMLDGYNDETPVYELEQITYYHVFPDTSTTTPYMGDLNLYDSVGNLKQNRRFYFKEDDTSKIYVRAISNYYYDTFDRLIKSVDAKNNTVHYAYDGFDRPITITDAENNVYRYDYNSTQNKVDLSLNARKLITQCFDLYGNVIENIAYPNGTATQINESYEYDLNNNAVSYTNANGNETTYLYDAANRLKEITLPDGTKGTSNYSAFNKPTFEKLYDANGNEKSMRTTYRNEKDDLRMKFFGFDGRLVDSNGYSSDAKGRTTSIREGINSYSLTYDELDHPIILTSGTSQIHRRYNWFGEVAAASTDGNTPEVRYGYDYVGNLNAKLQNDTYYMAYVYSSIGKVIQSQMPSERIENYTYTANGNLDTIVSDGKTFDYEYCDTGYVKSITYPNGLKTSYEYDNINRITSLMTSKNGATINTFEYEYDNNGNTTKEIRNGAATLYSYDNLDRLVSVTYSDGTSVAYEYDTLNNRTKETYSNGDVKNYVYNHKYQLTEIKLNGAVTDTFTYNGSGAVVTHNNKTYTYDEWDRMSGYSDGTSTYTYKYDANGIRTQKNDKQYVIDKNNNVVAETDSTGAITDEILWGNQPLARKTNGSWYYYIYNAHGDVVGLVNDSGTIVNTYEYTPWGEIKSENETVDNPIKYAGEYYDDELDMIYLRARYYAPSIGRFTSLDIEEGELSNPLDMNRYVYCRNNPIKYVDPSGKFAVTATAAAVELAPYIAAGVAAAVGAGIIYYKEHTKGARGSTHDKHTKKRPGAPSKASKKPGWKSRSNKKKP